MSSSALHNRRRYMGMSGGSLWLIVIGGVFMALSLAAVRTSAAMVLLAIIVAATIGLIAFAIATIRRVLPLPVAPADRALRRKIMLRFYIVLAAEALLCFLVVRVCRHTHHAIFIVPLILILVGLHFLPLARLFRVPRYYLMGASFCIIPIVTMLSVESSAHIGHALNWIVLPSIGCGLVALLTGWAGLNEVRQSLRNALAVAG